MSVLRSVNVQQAEQLDAFLAFCEERIEVALEQVGVGHKAVGNGGVEAAYFGLDGLAALGEFRAAMETVRCDVAAMSLRLPQEFDQSFAGQETVCQRTDDQLVQLSFGNCDRLAAGL